MAENPSFSLEGRRALITGASRGIGAALAMGLARAGANVALAARDLEGLKAIEDAIKTDHHNAFSLALDVRNATAAKTAIEDASKRLGGLDILINNAGVEEVRDSLEVDEVLWDKIVDTNLKGAFFCAQAAARGMAEAGGGAILNICSLTSEVGVPTAAAYGASKSGLLGMTRALAAEWAPRGIRVNGIGPGYFRTALTDVFYRDAKWQEAMLAKIPMRRFGHTDDLVGAAVFLCSDAAAYITGQCLYIDGGYMASI
jgi:NAD(P)-dependent dehydrogenase (short-subunit alcohol dehydrogenase family)